MRDYFLARLREPSTWRGGILFLTAMGLPIAPAMGEAIITLGLAVAGLVGMISPDA